jgi:hypothetical protein
VSVVLLENRLQSVGEGVGGTDPQARESANQVNFRPRERRDRTQEVAGSSPASSMRTRRKSAVFCWEGAHDYIQALGPHMHSAVFGTNTYLRDRGHQRPRESQASAEHGWRRAKISSGANTSLGTPITCGKSPGAATGVRTAYSVSVVSLSQLQTSMMDAGPGRCQFGESVPPCDQAQRRARAVGGER